MFLLFFNPPLWFMYSFLLIPLAVFLIARGIIIFLKGKSKVVTYFVKIPLILSSLIAISFLILGKAVPDVFLYFTLPFGLVSMFLFTLWSEESVIIIALVFLIGVFFNACAFGSLIKFTEDLFSWRKQRLK